LSYLLEKTAEERAYRKENHQLVALVCDEYENISDTNLGLLKEIESQNTLDRIKVNLKEGNNTLRDNIDFLKHKEDQVKLMEEHEINRQKREQKLQMDINEMQIMEKKKRLLVLVKQIKEEEIRLVEQEREMGVVADLVKSRLREQIAKTVVDFHKTDGINY
jgi:hypothetical protein